MKKLLYVALAVLLLMVVAMLFIGNSGKEPEAKAFEAPAIDGPDQDGHEMSLAEFRGKKVVMLDFWASWCMPCRGSFPHNRALVEKMKGRPFVLLGVSVDKDPENALTVIHEDNLTWRNWLDVRRPEKIATRYGVEYLPSVFLIDLKGMVRKRFEGAPGPATLDAAVESLVAEAEKELGG